jgi:hypothetical protein
MATTHFFGLRRGEAAQRFNDFKLDFVTPIDIAEHSITNERGSLLETVVKSWAKRLDPPLGGDGIGYLQDRVS